MKKYKSLIRTLTATVLALVFALPFFACKDNGTDNGNSGKTNEIKNIIYLIPDGAGFGTYDIANALKEKYGTGVYGQATPITTNAIEGSTANGLYLNDYMIASANTKLANPHGVSPTDSAAAGTALLCGTKTNYLMVGTNSDMHPVANILEACRLDGKKTGFVTTKCLVDATPSTATAHSLKRADQDNCAYQKDVSLQILNSGIDVLLCYGSDGGYYAKSSTQGAPLHDDNATKHGYTVINDLTSLESAVNGGATKLFSDVQINYKEKIENGYYGLTDTNYAYSTVAYNCDYQAHHLLYDCDAVKGTDLTLMDYAKAALTTLSVNANDPDGFCLVIEGGAIDNAAEGRYVKEAVSEYLAFDEVFGYCVNWAKKRNDTVVIACPDHDSGGFYDPANANKAPQQANKAGIQYTTTDSLLEALAEGTVESNTVLAGAVIGHSPQNVPVWLYAPDFIRDDILECLGLPSDTCAEKVRSGSFYDGTEFNEDYVILNSDIAPAILKATGITSLETATQKLFCDCSEFGTFDTETETFTFVNGETVKRNSTFYTDANGNKHDFECGMAIFMTNPSAYEYDGNYDSVTTETVRKQTFATGKATAVFYVPYSVLSEMDYA